MTELPPKASKAARALLGWTRDTLALKSGHCAAYISELEQNNWRGRTLDRKAIIVRNVHDALVRAGIVFIRDHRGIVGCMLEDRTTAATNDRPETPGNPPVLLCDLTGAPDSI